MQIYHNSTGNSNIIKTSTGDLYLQSSSDVFIQTKSNEASAYFLQNGSVELYYDNSKKFETTGAGATVFGTLETQQLNVSGVSTFQGNVHLGDDDRLRLGDGNDLEIFHNGTHTFIVESGAGALKIQGANINIDNEDGSKRYIDCNDGGSVELFHDGTKKFDTTTTGIDVTGTTDTDQLNVSGVSTFQGNVHLGDDDRLRLGASQDLQIYHSSNINRIEADQQLFLKGTNINLYKAGSSELMASFIQDGAVELYHDNSKKLETTTTGAKVTGALEVTQEYPSIRPTFDLNFAATKTLDRRVTFNRDSFATYIDDLGLVRTVSNNVPRFDHDSATGESLGLLVEEERTNLSYNSQDFTNNSSSTAWRTGSGYSRATLVSNTGIDDPSGGSTASRWSSGTTNSAELIYHILPAALTVGATYTASVWMRRVTQTGPVELILGDNVAVNVTSQLDAVPFGQWVRVSASRTITGSGGTRAYIAVKPNGSSPTTIDIWGYQAEEGHFVTSYIPTSDATVTRAADRAYINDVRVYDWFNELEGTVMYEHTQIPSGGSARYPSMGFGLTNSGTSTRSVQVFYNIANEDTYYLVRTSGGDVSNIGSGSGFFTPAKVSFCYKKDDFVLARNGSIVGTDTSGDLPDNFFFLSLGQNGASNTSHVLNARIKRFSYYPKRLPNAQLQGLTQQ